MMIIDLVAGARPNFMKIAALVAVAGQFPDLKLRFVHTGQHYDANMSDVFLAELGLPAPAVELHIGSGSHATQTAHVMTRYEEWSRAFPPDLTVVVGDVNSTVACALAASKLGIPVAHVEAGLRSFDRSMPEEINRIATDSISDLLFATEPAAVANLAREGQPSERIFLVGQVMIDSLLRLRPSAEQLRYHETFGLPSNDYAYVTLHRPANVDKADVLAQRCEQLVWLAEQLPVVFPAHPRTAANLRDAGLWDRLQAANMHLIEPASYLQSLSLLAHARLVVTDSGGLQEEASAVGVPCLTLRDSTERPITLTEGTNHLVGRDDDRFRSLVMRVMRGELARAVTQIPYWDGMAGTRILTIIQDQLPLLQ